MKSEGLAKRFYVYRLIDPRNDETFYVGKGQRDRAWQHQKEASRRRTSNPRKVERIRSILFAGFDIEVEIIEEFEIERDALVLEMRLIESLTTLTNMMPGCITCLSADERKRREEQTELSSRIKRAKEAAAKRECAAQRVERKIVMSVPGAKLHLPEIRAWVYSDVVDFDLWTHRPSQAKSEKLQRFEARREARAKSAVVPLSSVLRDTGTFVDPGSPSTFACNPNRRR